MGDHVAIEIDNKDVPFPFCAFRGVVVFEGGLPALFVITLQRPLHQVYRELLPIHQVNAIVVGRGEKDDGYDNQRDSG